MPLPTPICRTFGFRTWTSVLGPLTTFMIRSRSYHSSPAMSGSTTDCGHERNTFRNDDYQQLYICLVFKWHRQILSLCMKSSSLSFIPCTKIIFLYLFKQNASVSVIQTSCPRPPTGVTPGLWTLGDYLPPATLTTFRNLWPAFDPLTMAFWSRHWRITITHCIKYQHW